MKPAILVVDDDTAVCELLQDVLSEHVFSVLVCHNGQDALSLVQHEPHIALVLLDMMLPDINGLQVLLHLQKQRPELPVVMLTGLGSESDVVVGWRWGPTIILANRLTRAWWLPGLKPCFAVPGRWPQTPRCHAWRA